MWNIILYFRCYSKLINIVVILCGVLAVIKAEGCGGYIEPSSGSSGFLQSKNYGTGDYDAYTNCIWIFQSPTLHQTKLTITFVGELYDGSCADYIEIKDGSDSADTILSEFCGTYTNEVVTSTARWMYLRFKTDSANATTGLYATYTAVHAGAVIDNATNPIKACRSHEFECSNKRCLTRAYLCDDINDCGCDVNCDEDSCDGLGIEKFVRIGFSAGIGAGSFVLLCGIIFCTDRLSKRREIRKRQEEEEKEKRGKRRGGNKKEGGAAAAKRKPGSVKKGQVEPEPGKIQETKIFWHS